MSEDATYQQEYDAAMAALEDGETATATIEPESTQRDTDTKAEEITSEDPLEVIRKELEAARKALADTQRWGHENAAEIKRLRAERDAQQHAATRPPLLDEFEGLEEAVKYVAQAPQPTAIDPQAQWTQAVSTAHPDAESLLSDPDFDRDIRSRASAVGQAWSDPLVAIREITEAKLARAERLKQTAIEAARRDFEARQQKKSAMSMPSGQAGTAPTTQDPDSAMVQRYQTMSDEEFNREVNRVLGF